MPLEGSLTEFTRAYVAATQTRRADMRWDLAETVIQSARGIARADHDGPARGQGRRGRGRGPKTRRKKKSRRSYAGGFRIQMRPRPHPIILEYSPRRYFFCFCSNMRSSL